MSVSVSVLVSASWNSSFTQHSGECANPRPSPFGLYIHPSCHNPSDTRYFPLRHGIVCRRHERSPCDARCYSLQNSTVIALKPHVTVVRSHRCRDDELNEEYDVIDPDDAPKVRVTDLGQSTFGDPPRRCAAARSADGAARVRRTCPDDSQTDSACRLGLGGRGRG